MNITQIIVILSVLFIIIFDIIIYKMRGVESTVSRIVLYWAKEYPIIPFAVGVVIGHLFWAQTPICL